MLKSEVVNVPSGPGVQATPASPSYTGGLLFARGVVQVQMVPPFYTSIYIALVSVINTKFSQIVMHNNEHMTDFCLLKKEYVECFEKVFQDQYDIVYRLENVKFFAHLLVTDAISWDILCCLVLTNEDTTSSSRVYMKNLFLESAESIGITQRNNRLTDRTLVEYFDGLFPRNDPKKTRFSRNFFTSIGRGGLTDDLREFITTDSC
ncbi:unnamed protein product [Rotaria socialis]|uniref:Uncharacterized protein n=2 Tax=Rotaria socialis TaxID=392032 RepID=A0A819YVL0_9BILA|nr:unnamed protein product [Rotaria socialis]